MSAQIIFKYLQAMAEHNASDLYITCGYPPSLRVFNEFLPLSESVLTSKEIDDVIAAILTTRQRRDFEIHNELNSSLDIGDKNRFRVNVLRQRQEPALVIRRITADIPSFESLNLPPILEKLCMEKRGLVLVTGMTGAGKSTTLAAMIDHRNASAAGHIITVEDPIEFFHDHKKSIITQREVGVDTDSFSVAMKNALRQRPDVMLVGEIRDREAMEHVLTISETGHLCLATIHTSNAYQAIDRIVNMFPEEMHAQVRLNLSLNLKAIISQRLVPTLQGGLAPAFEVLLNQGLVKELIQKGQAAKMHEIMQQNIRQGMCTFDQSLLSMYANQLISRETALAQADQESDMLLRIKALDLSGNGEGSGGLLKDIDTSILSLSE